MSSRFLFRPGSGGGASVKSHPRSPGTRRGQLGYEYPRKRSGASLARFERLTAASWIIGLRKAFAVAFAQRSKVRVVTAEYVPANLICNTPPDHYRVSQQKKHQSFLNIVAPAWGGLASTQEVGRGFASSCQ